MRNPLSRKKKRVMTRQIVIVIVQNSLYSIYMKLNEQKSLALVLDCIEQAGSISRAAIAKEMDLSRTTVSGAVTQLIDLRLIQEDEQVVAMQSRGRPGIPISLTTNEWYAVGATYIDHDLLFAMTDLTGNVVLTYSKPLADGSADTYLATLAQGLSEFIPQCPGKLLPLIGVGSPGMIDCGCVQTASDMGWSKVNISDYLWQKLHMPSIVINRHWASCLSEYNLSAAPDVQSQVYVGISTGICASFIINGKLFTGSHNGAGEIGHTVVNREGPICTCGRRGCLHAISSENAIIKQVRDYYLEQLGPACRDDELWNRIRSGQELDFDSICRAAERDNPVAVRQLRTASLYLGLSIGNLISMFNPQLVVLGGSLIDHGGQFLTDMIIESVKEHASTDALLTLKIKPWSLGRYSAAIGAAHLVLQNKLAILTKQSIENPSCTQMPG